MRPKASRRVPPRFWNATLFEAELEVVALSFATQAQRPRIIMNVPPPYPGYNSKWGEPEASPINDGTLRAAVYAIATRHGWDVADQYVSMGGVEHAEEVGRDVLYDDSVHPNGDGLAILASTVRDGVAPKGKGALRCPFSPWES